MTLLGAIGLAALTLSTTLCTRAIHLTAHAIRRPRGLPAPMRALAYQEDIRFSNYCHLVACARAVPRRPW